VFGARVTDRNSPIFVLDSGLGGLTVVRAILSQLPGERVVYFGDTARLPYGSKTKETVTAFVRQIINWGSRIRPKCVVIACNTASALALPGIKLEAGTMIMAGVIEPGARAAATAAGTDERATIGVIATEATVRSQAYQNAIRRRRRLVHLLVQPTPLLVPMIEEGRTGDDPVVELALRQYLQPMLARGINTLVLGCTHYPLLTPAIQRIVGPNVKVIDSARKCAHDIARRLDDADLLASCADDSAMQKIDAKRLSIYVTDDPDRFQRLAPRFLGFEVDAPTLVPPEVLYHAIDTRASELRPSA